MTPQHATLELNIHGVDHFCASHLKRIIKALVIFIVLFSGEITLASENASSELNCSSSALQTQYSSSGACVSPNGIFPQALPEGSLQQHFSQQRELETIENIQRTAKDAASQPKHAS